MKSGFLATLLILVILVSVSAGYLVGTGHQVASTSISTATTLATTTVTTLSIAQSPTLQLIAIVSPKTVSPGQNVSVVAGVYNPLQNNVTVSGMEIDNPSQAPCGRGIDPVAIRVYQGHYSLANISTATPLLLYNASGPPPPCAAPFGSIEYTFLPDTDRATATYLPTGVLVVNETITLSGYWVPSLLSGPGNYYHLHAFDPGIYTVLIFDTWGQQMVEYFHVSVQPP